MDAEKTPTLDEADEPWMMVAKFFFAMCLCLPISWVAAFFVAEWFNIMSCPAERLSVNQICTDQSIWRQDVFLVCAAWIMAFFIWVSGLVLGYWRMRQPKSVLIFYSLFSIIMPIGAIALTVSWLGTTSSVLWCLASLTMTWFSHRNNH